jgi:WhiB family transcriptional regulator, redox-sensing transcriptional regulator
MRRPNYDGTQACADHPYPDVVFFPPERRGVPREARELCRRCTFRVDCAAYAMANDFEGIWGGTTYEQRRRAQGKKP